MNESIDRGTEALLVEFPAVVEIERRCHLAHVARRTRTGVTPFDDVRPPTERVQGAPAD